MSKDHLSFISPYIQDVCVIVVALIHIQVFVFGVCSNM